MRMFERLRASGLRGMFVHELRKLSGFYEYRDKVDTLYYYLNHFVDITSLPPAKGALRKMQLCDAVMLGIFDEICRSRNWRYWLSWGTLLGAARHRGFIPWDDDMDVCMPREDYNKAMKELPEIFASYGDDSLACYIAGAERIGFGYEHIKTGIWCDIFPVDEVKADSREELSIAVSRYKSFYKSRKDIMTQEQLDSERLRIINYGGGGYVFSVHSPEFSYRPFICKSDIIFPTGTVQFEGYTLTSPADIHEYLTCGYGDYMLFPSEGVEHHAQGRGALSSWAERSGIDMDEVLVHLKDIEQFFSHI